jgi:hypothetical protein
MRLRPTLLLLLGLLLAAGCAPSGPGTVPGAAGHTWAGVPGGHYRYDFERQCFCVPEATQPVTIEVRDGAVVSVRSRATGEEVVRSENIPWYSIEGLLAQANEARAEGQEVAVQYDAATGHPTLVEIGSLAADAGVRYLVANVQPLP